MRTVNIFRVALAFVMLAGFVVSCNKDTDLVATDSLTSDVDSKMITFKKSEVIPGQYIVIFKNNQVGDRALKESSYEERKAMMREKAEAVLNSLRIDINKIDRTYGTALKGFSVANFTEEEAKALAGHQDIEYIEQDQTISIQGGPPGGGGGGGGGGNPSQTKPWGITRVNGGVDGTGKRAWIIDSGIDLDHPDLNVDVANGANFSSGNSPDDGNGHGTHVSGTVAAIDNEIGVIGVAAGAWVVPVRVLNNAGSGTTSGVIAGVDYVAAHAGSNDVANMSLGGGISTSLDNAVIAASSTCDFALAAGNESDNVNNHSPARANAPGIYTIASMTSSNIWSSFSNYGQPTIENIAPGSSIYSTYKGGGYATLSGTSMASPHVCGILLLGNVANGGSVTRVSGDVYTVASH